jgi:hypothetical protein
MKGRTTLGLKYDKYLQIIDIAAYFVSIKNSINFNLSSIRFKNLS